MQLLKIFKIVEFVTVKYEIVGDGISSVQASSDF